MPLPHGRFSFRVVGPIGEGGLGTVDEIEVTESNASHPVGARLARKRLGAQWAALPMARERFEREISSLRAMQHPNIITVQGENVAGGERFYCMPKCERSYRKVLEGSPSGFTWRSVATLGVTLASALNYAHSLGFYHRDLKPENILLDSLNNVYLADWGIGYFIHKESKVLPKLTRGGGLGTEYYCSLEQWTGAHADPKMDVYSLGILLAELVQGKQIAGLTVGFGIQTDVVPALTAGAVMFNSILRQMTALFPAQRVASMRHVITILSQAIAADQPASHL